MVSVACVEASCILITRMIRFNRMTFGSICGSLRRKGGRMNRVVSLSILVPLRSPRLETKFRHSFSPSLSFHCLYISAHHFIEHRYHDQPTDGGLQMYQMFGWRTMNPRGLGIHGVTRADLRTRWSHLYGQRHIVHGSTYGDHTPSRHFWLDMWIPQTRYRTHERLCAA
jgi:hypothetical protein